LAESHNLRSFRAVFGRRSRDRVVASQTQVPLPLLDAARWITNRPPVEAASRLGRPTIDEDIRRDPNKWIGDVRRPTALGTLVEGALAFALDDAAHARCCAIELRIHRDGSASVRHDGPGFDPQRASRGLQRWPWLRTTSEGELVLTRAIAAPVVTNALSHWCRFEVSSSKGVFGQAFYRGKPQCPVQRVGTLAADAATQTLVRFKPDPIVFAGMEFDVDDLYMRGLGSLLELPGVRLTIVDERSKAEPLVIDGSMLSLG
jgi:DNA gyrase subunit B